MKENNNKKNSFSCLAHSNIGNTMTNILSLDSLEVQDTIKGEDNINISKFKMRFKNIKKKTNKLY